MLFLLPELFGKLFFWATLNGKKRNGCFVKHIHLTKGKRDIKHFWDTVKALTFIHVLMCNIKYLQEARQFNLIFIADRPTLLLYNNKSQQILDV